MKPSETKANRLLQIETLLIAHTEGLTQAVIARRLEVALIMEKDVKSGRKDVSLLGRNE